MNRSNLIHLLILFSGFALFSCSVAQSQSKKNKDKEDNYQEDLSKVRPEYKLVDSSAAAKEKNTQPVVPSNDMTQELNSLLDSVYSNNKTVRYAQGFRILVYSGRSSAEVRTVRTKVYQLLPDADIYQDFRSPNQRVKVGNCINRREAYRLHGKLKKEFPHSVIIPDQIIIKAK